MADQESLLNLTADEVAVAAFLAGNGGHLTRDGKDAAVYWLRMRPAGAPSEVYYVRVAWSAYPHEAPSVKFADSIGGSLAAASAWPVIPGYRPASFDICKPMTAEGYALHAGWRTGQRPVPALDAQGLDVGMRAAEGSWWSSGTSRAG
jgi:hypothetical protein